MMVSYHCGLSSFCGRTLDNLSTAKPLSIKSGPFCLDIEQLNNFDFLIIVGPSCMSQARIKETAHITNTLAKKKRKVFVVHIYR